MARGMSPEQLRAMWASLKGKDRATRWRYLTRPQQRALSELLFPLSGQHRGIYKGYVRRGFTKRSGNREQRKILEHRQSLANLLRESRQRGRASMPLRSQGETLHRYRQLMTGNIERRLSRIKTSYQRASALRDLEVLSKMKERHIAPLHMRLQHAEQRYNRFLRRRRQNP